MARTISWDGTIGQKFLITGCSGGGKSTLCDRLAARGLAVVHEPGLRIIQAGGPKPWEDLPAFAKAATAMAKSDLANARARTEPLIFDRGLFDALSGLAARTKKPITEVMPKPFPYSQPVFFARHWPEIFENTDERQLPFEAALDEATRLRRDLDMLGIHVVELPRASVEDRVEIVMRTISST